MNKKEINKKHLQKLLKSYQDFANAIDNDIKIKKGEIWQSIPLLNEIYVPMPSKKIYNKPIEDFLYSVYVKLPQEQKNIVNIIPYYIWTFLHEMGHIQNNDIKDSFISIRKITDFLSYHFGHINIIDKLTTYLYFNLPEEKKATQWAINYINKNYDTVRYYANQITKNYNKYYRNYNPSKC